MKKWFVMLLIFLLLGSTLCACSNTRESQIEDETPDESSGISFVGFKVYNSQEEDDYIYYDVLVKNETGGIINTLSVDVQYLDEEGNIIDTSYPQVPVRVFPNQIIALDGLVEKDLAESMTVTGFNYYMEDEFVIGQFEQIPNVVSLSDSQEYYEREVTEFEDSAIYADVETDETSLLSIEKLEAGEVSDGYISYYAYIKNDSGFAINTVGINIIYLDEKGNISGVTYPQVSTVVQPGQVIRIESLVLQSEAQYVTVDGYSFYDENDEFFQGYFTEIPKAISLS